jgi:tetratricopeptide (TPR) repeat protein
LAVKRSALFLLALSVCCFVCPNEIPAEEPARQFLDALRDRGYYDVAIDYLSQVEKSDLVNAEFKKELPFEKAITLIRSTTNLRDKDKIDGRLDQAQKLLTAYASQNKSLKVSAKTLRFKGNLLYLRSNSYVRQAQSDRLTAGEKKALLDKAREFLTQSLQSYEQAKTQIQRLIDPNSDDAIILDAQDPSTKRDRDSFRNLYTDVRVALPMVAEKLGDTYPEGNPQRKKQLEKAAKEYTDVYNSYRRFLSGLKACVYAARCNRKLGKYKPALVLLNDILELGDNTALKPLKLEAYVLAADCWNEMKPYPYTEIIKRLDPAVKVLNRIEVKNPNWLRVQMELAKAKYAAAEAIQKKGGPKAGVNSRSMKQSAARVLRNVARSPGELRDKAREMLAEWKVPLTETADPNEKPPESFVDARQKGKDLIGEIEMVLAESNTLKKQIKAARDPAKKTELQNQLGELDSQLKSQAMSALDYFNLALSFSDEETIRADINNVRYLQSFCYFVSGQYFESALIGEFLLSKYPTVDGTRQAMSLLVQSYNILLNNAKDNEKQFEFDRLTTACSAVVERWPGSNEAGTAASTMTRLNLNAKKYPAAEDYFSKIPSNATYRDSLGSRLGQRMFLDYRSKTAGGQSSAELTDQLQRAKKYMADGVNSADPSKLDYETAQGALLLVDAFLSSGEVDKAVNQLESAPIAPLELVKTKNPAVTKSRYSALFARETYKTAVNVYLAAMKNAEDKQKWTDKASGIIAGMRRDMEASKDPKDLARITTIYRMIAIQLKSSFNAITDPAEKKKFADTLAQFLGSIEKDSNDSKTVLWAGSTLLTVAESLAQSGAIEAAKPKFQQASSALSRAEGMGFKGDPQEAKMLVELKRQRALAKRGSGDFDGAVKQFVEILRSSGPALNLQLDATETLQMRAKAQKRPKGYVEAIKGAEPVKDPKTKRTTKLIWGWEKIAGATRKIEKFRTTYYRALYHVVECRYEYGVLEKQQSAINSALKEISNQRKRDATFSGNAEWKAKFDELEKRISQKK